ncbi:hypothetical protein OAO78_04050 [Methylophilaceae bacterium]|jgi:hypothetical protein|nr:hypothetical protein [Methylophilaceae bacterium]MDC0626814.1 hypothetical protein [Methylophilaceae bacterium]NCV27950.1 hypothetical protein [Nitrosomonadales bacterium]NCV53846.1 hypothetical protein [Betaproteobacteria bacterium]NCX68052.1 hypothetical protein [Betaproteobacteria bacterium]
MKKLIFLFLLFSFSSFADEDISISEAPLVDELPVNELEFVETIGLLTPDEVEKILGEPKKIVNITLQSSKEVIASSWYYENINTDHSGNYYPITEIDIVDGYIESVVFLNSNMDEIDRVEGQKYDVKRPEKVF